VFELESFDEHGNEPFYSMRQGCALCSALFSIFKVDVLRKLDEVNNHSPVMPRKHGSGSLSAHHQVGDIATSTGLQTAINCVHEFCNEWKLKNLGKTTTALFMRGGKLSTNEMWRLGPEEIGRGSDIWGN
jgi:hypothetical protein